MSWITWPTNITALQTYRHTKDRYVNIIMNTDYTENTERYIVNYLAYKYHLYVNIYIYKRQIRKHHNEYGLYTKNTERSIDEQQTKVLATHLQQIT